MRITARDKAATRARIISVAKGLFRTKGFQLATTRDIAREAGIATGTIFNYFDSKEAIVVELAQQALRRADTELTGNRRSEASLAEDLFSYIATQIRHLRPLRTYIRPLLDTAFSSTRPPQPDRGSLQKDLNEDFAGILAEHSVGEPSVVALNLLWTLYVGILTFWGNDKSPKQEDSLALLDESMSMYADWVQ